ncbi:MAG: NUDIX hydrolase [Bacteroidales bacterium]|nr:NUDIX hydrolase [Bacteroidales bacterium]
MAYTYRYLRPAITTDAVVLSKNSSETEVLLIQRKKPPFRGYWAFPGGFVEMDETLETCAARELKEETGLDNVALYQFRAYSEVDRDPRGRTISVVFYGFADPEEKKVVADDDASEAQWFPISYLPKLAFDHHKILTGILTFLNKG